MFNEQEVELFQNSGIVYQLWIQYKDGVYCKATEVDDITEALKVLEILQRRPNVINVYIREVRTTANIILETKG